MFQRSNRIKSFGQDVWSIFSPLAIVCKSVNLGQGFPNMQTPAFVKKAAQDAIESGVNQYAPPRGNLRLRQALAQMYPYDPESEIMIAAGANEGMYALFMAFLNPGDEVICFEPFFDQYAPNIIMADAKMVCVPFRPEESEVLQIPASSWKIDMEELKSKVTSRTKMIVVNTPHNPSGKVFTKNELEDIAQICKDNNLICISDEVYEHLTFEAEHVRISSLPGMREHTITVGSGGKSFCTTGWRVGYLMGPQSLIDPTLIAHSRIVFCANHPLQEGVARSLEQTMTNGFFEKQRLEYLERRDYLLNVFKKLGLRCTVPQGAYFIMVDISKLNVPSDQLEEAAEVELQFTNGVRIERTRDWQICRWLCTHIKVAAIPPSEFYSPANAHLAAQWARFAFCKEMTTLKEARDNLQKLIPYIQS